MMNRVVIDGAIFGLQKAGGISRFWGEVLLGLDAAFAKDNRISLLLPPNQNVEWARLANQIKKIKVIPRKCFEWNKRGFFQESLYLTWLALKLRPAVWHSSFYVGLPLKFYGHTIHSFYDMIPEVLGDPIRYDSHMKYRALKRANTIVAISNHSRRDLSSIWPECAHKIEVIHLCANKSKNKKDKKTLSIPTPYFLFVGKRGGYKNFLKLLKYLLSDSRFDNYHIVAVGGENGFSEKEQVMIHHLEARERVHYVGTLPTEEVERLIHHANALLYPSIYEGFGLPILEAFAHEIPVLACKCSSIPEIAGKEYPLADPNAPETLPDVLATLLKEQDKWVAYGKQRRKLFSQPKMIRALSDLYVKNF